MAGCAGLLVATVSAAALARMLANAGICTGGEVFGITATLVAGSSMCLFLSNLISYFGLGNGTGFIYMISITAGEADS
jgi:preprotein translocase subunit SecY